MDPSAATMLIAAASAAILEHGDGELHTVAAAVLDEHGQVHIGLNPYYFTGGPCAELVALATARAGGAQTPRLIVAVRDDGRGVLAPCGRDRQVLTNHYPGISVVVTGPDGVQVAITQDLLPPSYSWRAQQVKRLRFRASHLPRSVTGANVSPCASTTPCRPVQVGPVLLVVESDDEVTLAGRSLQLSPRPFATSVTRTPNKMG